MGSLAKPRKIDNFAYMIADTDFAHINRNKSSVQSIRSKQWGPKPLT